MKANGRLAPARKEETASLKGKEMLCPKCSKVFSMGSIVFGVTKCTDCGELLLDKDFAFNKLVGN